ncbi:MAG: ATP-binding protein [Nitrososphaerota archaeon]
MENIKDQYTYPLEEAAIVENIDNAIDERYEDIVISFEKGILKILMLGDGMDKRTFNEILPRIAATTKFEAKSKVLGRYGWGMKIAVGISNQVWVETKKGSFRGAQLWALIDKIPQRADVEPKEIKRECDFTLVEMDLKEDYATKLSRETIVKIIQKFYPTILNGAKVINRYGHYRKVRIFYNSEQIPPPIVPKIAEKQYLKAKIGDKEATGCVFLVEQDLPEQERGINIIVHGRAIKREFFSIHHDMDKRITGYIHADFLIEDLYGDKTQIKTSSRYKSFAQQMSKQLLNFAEKIGAFRESTPVHDIVRHVLNDINKLVRDFPELKALFQRAIKKEFLQKSGGKERSSLGNGLRIGRGIESGEGGGKGVPWGPGPDEGKAPTGELGDLEVVQRKRRGGLAIKPGRYSRQEESWFLPPGVVIINQSFPTYLKAEKLGKRTLEYHVGRCVVEAILNYAITEGEMKPEDRSLVLAKWGEL